MSVDKTIALSHHPKQSGAKKGENPDTNNQDLYAFKIICSGCNHLKDVCRCHVCILCSSSFFGGDSIIVGRHHCRCCFRPICSSCRDETKSRWNPRFCQQQREAFLLTPNVYYCKRCAPMKSLGAVLKMEMYDFKKNVANPSSSSSSSSDGLDLKAANLWKSRPKRGLILLFQSMNNCPRRCIDTEQCAATFTDELSCPACLLPTVPMAPFVEKMPKTVFDAESLAHLRTLRAEMRQDNILAERFDPCNREKLQKMEEAIFDERKFWHPPAEIASVEFRDVLFACVASSVCYEYNRFPRMMLEAMDIPVAKLMRPIEVHASFTIFEASGDRIIIAFPGTHDTRTILNDLNAGRTFVTETAKLNGGNTARSGGVLNNGVVNLYGYKLHTGFLRAATLLEHRLPTSTIKRFIKSGKRVICAGHSAGAVLGSLITLRVLSQEPDLMRQRTADGKYPLVQCIGFGTPLIGNSALKNRIHRAGLSHLFLHVVHATDIVPRLLTVRRAHEEVMETVKTKVEEVKNKVVAAGNSLISRISSFFERKKEEPPIPVVNNNNNNGDNAHQQNHYSNNNNNNHHLPQLSPVLAGLRSGCATPPPGELSLGGSASNFTFCLNEVSYVEGNGRATATATTAHHQDPTLQKQTNKNDNNNSNNKKNTNSCEIKKTTTLEVVRASADLDDEDIHEVYTSANDLCILGKNNNNNDDDDDIEDYGKQTKPRKTAKPAAPFHQPVSAATSVKVKSPFDTFGRYLFLAPTAEGLLISSPKSSRLNSLAEFPSSDSLPSENENKDYSNNFQYSAMRVTVMLVEDPAQSFGVLRNTTGPWMKSVEDHWLDGYQRALMMSCFKG